MQGRRRRGLRSMLVLGVLLGSGVVGAHHGGIHLPAPREGDQAAYDAAPGSGVGDFAFTWLPAATLLDRWGRPFRADVLESLVPADELAAEDSGRSWRKVHEAYAGPAGEPAWRVVGEQRVRDEDMDFVELPLLGVGFSPAARDIMHFENLSMATADPGPWLRTCLARHALQGRGVAPGGLVPLTDLCPGLGQRVRASPVAARGASFQGRDAVELRYDVEARHATGDLPLPPRGTLRLVLADGLAHVALAEARGEGGEVAWRVALGGFAPGHGPEAGLGPDRRGRGEPARLPGARLAPLGSDGPADGGSGLPYRLDEALANVRSDPTLHAFREWSGRHPAAFLVDADLWLPTSGEKQRFAYWTLLFGDPRPDGRMEAMAVWSSRWWPWLPPETPDLPAEVPGEVRNGEGAPHVMDSPVRRPTGEPALDVASALEAFAVHLAPEGGRGDLHRVAYRAPAPDGPARLRVEREVLAPEGSGTFRAMVVIDASTGAATHVGRYHRQSVYGTLGALPDLLRPLAVSGQGFALPDVAGLEVAGVTLAALLAVLLGHAGHLTVAYSRLRRSDLLEHPVRQRIYDLVRQRPGIHAQGILEAAGVGRGDGMYHLRVLERGGLLAPVALRKFRRYFVSGTVPHRELLARAELRAGRSQALYDIVRREPGLTLAELARRMQVTPPAAHKTVERLRAAGLLEKQADGRLVRIVARDPGQRGGAPGVRPGDDGRSLPAPGARAVNPMNQ